MGDIFDLSIGFGGFYVLHQSFERKNGKVLQIQIQISNNLAQFYAFFANSYKKMVELKGFIGFMG